MEGAAQLLRKGRRIGDEYIVERMMVIGIRRINTEKHLVRETSDN